MKYKIKRKDLASELELERSPWSGRVLVTQKEKALVRLKEKNGPFEVQMKDGSKKKMIVKARFLDPVPAVMLGEEEILLAEKLRFIDYLFGCFPVLMFLVYGPFTTLVAFFLLMGNFRILRSSMRPSVKWAAIYGMDLVVFWIVMPIVKFVLQTAK